MLAKHKEKASNTNIWAVDDTATVLSLVVIHNNHKLGLT